MQNATSAFALLAVICGMAGPSFADEFASGADGASVMSAQYERANEEPGNDFLAPLPEVETGRVHPQEGYFNATADGIQPTPLPAGPVYDGDVPAYGVPATEFVACVPPNRMYFRADAIWLTRSAIADQVVVEKFVMNVPLLSTNNVDLSNRAAAGAEFTLGQRIDDVSAIEVSFFGLNHWGSSAAATVPGSLTLPGMLPLTTNDFIFANTMVVDYTARLNNLEANYQQTLMGSTFLIGLRYFNLDESFNIQSFGSSATPSDYNVTARNNLFGGQLGAALHQEYGRLGIDLLGKAGGYANAAQQHTMLSDVGNSVVLRDVTSRGSPISFLGELKVTGTFRVTDWLSIRGGYRAMWVSNVAFAANQLDFTATPYSGNELHVDNSLFLHGAFGGFEARW